MKSDNVLSWLIRFLKGIFIGASFILPGISGSVIAAVFGVYERMVKFLADIKHDFRANFKFFLPIAIGGILGVFLVSAFLSVALDVARVQLIWFFICCIIGTLPQLWRNAGKFGRRKVHYTVLAASAILAFAVLILIERTMIGEFPLNFGTWIFAGGLIGLVAIIPGFSASTLLYFFGVLEPMADGIATFDVSVIIPLIIGGLIAIIAFSKLMAFVLRRAYSGLFHAIIGFVLASTVVIVPLDFNYISIGGLICLVAAIAGAAVSRLLCNLDKQK